MTIRNAIEAILQRFKDSAPDTPDAAHPQPAPGPYVGQDPWLMELYARLQRELDDLYETAEQDDGKAQRRIALILRAFHLMESGEYGLCACCDAAISRDRLEADPTYDTCKDCG